MQQIISPNNVAVYGGLCALASFDRQELQKKVLSSRCDGRFVCAAPVLDPFLLSVAQSAIASVLHRYAL